MFKNILTIIVSGNNVRLKTLVASFATIKLQH